uniref:M14 family metallopeptidase n=1 Tax=Ningiella ruwaisensis TaxID=2364274 RepID=UPI00109FA9B0|nr:M14 family metallocarboxypeptidase [Ningiella ruwaisensis]
MTYQPYPVGTPGKAWKESEIQQWRRQQGIKRSYRDEVISKVLSLEDRFDLIHYGALPQNTARYPLYALKSKNWRNDKPSVLITGGVHGYETSGVQGALLFAQTQASNYSDAFNFIVAPCINPWAYETINRWNPQAVDPNRSFKSDGPSPEANAIMNFMAKYQSTLVAHFDLHETTDTDNSEFRPALAARDGIEQDKWDIPDGFYTVADSRRLELDFQGAVIESVEQVTHIAEPDANGKLIGSKMLQPGVIEYDKASLYLCGGFTQARFVTTTEVYPDSPRATPEQCNRAQVAAITGGLKFIRAMQSR